MRCAEVIHELATPSGRPKTTAVAEHLARCPTCAQWARRAAQLDQLWEATHSDDPSPETWDRVWNEIAQSLHAQAASRIESPVLVQPSLNGASSSPKILAHSGSVRPAARSHARRFATVAWVGLAQAAAVLIALGLWRLDQNSSQKRQPPRIANVGPVETSHGRSPISVAAPIRVDADIEEGHLVVIRAEGPVPQLVDVTPPEMFDAVRTAKPAYRPLGLLARSTEEMFYPVKVGRPVGQREDPWYAMFNAVESIEHPFIAAR
jgi:hypothetical protein